MLHEPAAKATAGNKSHETAIDLRSAFLMYKKAYDQSLTPIIVRKSFMKDFRKAETENFHETIFFF